MFRSLSCGSITFVCLMVFLASANFAKVQAQENNAPQGKLSQNQVWSGLQQPHQESFTSVAAAQKKKAKAKKAPQKKGPQVWAGDEDLAGYGALTFRLSAGGKAVMIDAKETMAGTWTRDGDTLTITFGGGNIVYTGTINGQTVSGTARDLRNRWSFTVRRQ